MSASGSTTTGQEEPSSRDSFLIPATCVMRRPVAVDPHLRERSGSLAAPVLVHLAANSTAPLAAPSPGRSAASPR